MGAPYYPSSEAVIEKMLTLAGAGSRSVVYDLGCGDGRVVLAAARDYRVERAVGVEKNPKLCAAAREKTSKLKNVLILNADYDTVDLSQASIVTLYQSSTENARLKRKFLNELSEGSTVVSHDFGIPGWHPKHFETFREGRHTYRILVYEIGSHETRPRHR
jgi:SAM-dependent methyltransferase